jgi:hypothetical protein
MLRVRPWSVFVGRDWLRHLHRRFLSRAARMSGMGPTQPNGSDGVNGSFPVLLAPQLPFRCRPRLILVANSSAQRDHATMWRAENREIRVFAEGVSLCHSATLTRLTATAVMTCCKRVFANPM